MAQDNIGKALQRKFPPPRLEGEGQGGGVDKERGAKSSYF